MYTYGKGSTATVLVVVLTMAPRTAPIMVPVTVQSIAPATDPASAPLMVSTTVILNMKSKGPTKECLSPDTNQQKSPDIKHGIRLPLYWDKLTRVHKFKGCQKHQHVSQKNELDIR